MRKYLIVCLLFTYACQAFTQNVINAAGQVVETANLKLEYSVGELSTASLNLNGAGTTVGLTQGFLQPSYIIVGVNELFDATYGFQCYPNPTTGLVFVETRFTGFDRIQAFTSDGRTIIDDDFTYQPIDCSLWQAGSYVVRLSSTSKPTLKTFKIVKQ